MNRQLIIPEGTDRSKMRIAPTVRFGDALYVSGSAGIDPKQGRLAGEEIESQAGQAMSNLGEVLEAAGSLVGIASSIRMASSFRLG